MKLLRHVLAVAAVSIALVQSAPDNKWNDWGRKHSYASEDKDPFLIVADDRILDEDDLQDAVYSEDRSASHDAHGEPKHPFIIRVDEEESAKDPLDENFHEDLEQEQNRYIADVWKNSPESDGRRRDGRNAQQLRDQAARDLAEMNADLARQREALRRQEAADRARERDELRRYELEMRRQLEEQRRQDELQAQKDAQQALRDRSVGTQVGAAAASGRLGQQAAYEEYDAYNYDSLNSYNYN